MIRRSLLAALLAIAACSPRSEEQQPPETQPANSTAALTRRQLDSALGASAIPGAGSVTRAIRAADSLDAHTRAADSLGSAP